MQPPLPDGLIADIKGMAGDPDQFTFRRGAMTRLLALIKCVFEDFNVFANGLWIPIPTTEVNRRVFLKITNHSIVISQLFDDSDVMLDIKCFTNNFTVVLRILLAFDIDVHGVLTSNAVMLQDYKDCIDQYLMKIFDVPTQEQSRSRSLRSTILQKQIDERIATTVLSPGEKVFLSMLRAIPLRRKSLDDRRRDFSINIYMSIFRFPIEQELQEAMQT